MLARRVAVCALGFALLGATSALGEEQRVRVGGGSVLAPSGDWQREAAPDGSLVRFTRLHEWLGQTKGMTQIVVFRNRASAATGDDPAALAAAFLDEEERIMRELGVAAGDYALSDVVRGTRVVSGRTLHTLAYRKKLSALRFGRKRERAQLNLWFPDDFAQSRDFYGFLISELREKGALVADEDLAQIDAVITSFRVEAAAPQP